MSYVVFENPGEIDAAAIRTFGVSVKEGENPIGFFGTGLKYALAILLRTGHSVVIQSGLSKHRFALKDITIRGEKFQVVTMDRQELGFTSQVGKTWELWMAYRELHCNCKDEGGTVFIADQLPKPAAGFTRVIVGGEDFRNEHDRRSSFILLGEPWLKLENCEVYEGESRGIFYRGILVHRLPQAEVSKFTYNITAKVDLTEDRTAKHAFMFPHMIAASILQADDESFLNGVLALDNKFYEHHFDFKEPVYGTKPAAPFLKVVERLTQHAAGRTSLSAQIAYKSAMRATLAPATTTLVGVESDILQIAVKFARGLGFSVDDYPIIVTDALGPNILGMAENDRIYVSRLAFMQGTKRVAGTLVEEFIHLRYKYEDETRGMQEFLLDRLVSLGEQMHGEPL
jgi:hypothetical protein